MSLMSQIMYMANKKEKVIRIERELFVIASDSSFEYFYSG